MEYVTSIERLGYKRSLADGEEAGITKGIEQERKKGRRLGLLEGITVALDSKFDPEGTKLLWKVCTLQEGRRTSPIHAFSQDRRIGRRCQRLSRPRIA